MPPIPRIGTLRGEFFLGAYGTLGGEIELYGDWTPDEPMDVAADMLRLSGYLDNTEVPLITAANIAESDTQKRFDTETDPDGQPWISLDPDYANWKRGYGFTPVGESPSGDFILRLDSDLYKGATTPGAWTVSNDTLFFDPSSLPLYAVYHQVGTDTEGNVGLASEHRETLRSFRASGLGIPDTHKGQSQKENLGIGRGKALPARPFIGLSEEAINEIAFAFDLWFDEGVDEIFVHPHTGRAQHRLPSGRFGPGF